MDALSRPLIPPAPKVHARDLSSWRVALGIGRSTLGIWSERSFDELVITGRSFGIDSMLLSDPAGARHVLAAGAPYGRTVPFNRLTRPLAGSGVLLAEGGDWRRQRRMLAPMFTPGSVGLLLPHFIAAAETMAARLSRSGRANLSAVFHETALDAVLRALFSMPVTAERRGFARMVRSYVAGPGRATIFDGVARSEQDFSPDNGARRRFARERIAAVAALIDERRRTGNPTGQTDLLDLLLAARDADTGEPLADAEIGDQAATMLFAGFETTSRLLFWATYLLTLDVAEQTRLRREVLAFPPDRIGGLDDLQHWPRLRQVLLEALRLYPPVAHLTRESLTEDEVAGVRIAARTTVWISPWVMHRHRALWDRPTAFMPDRFAGVHSPWTSMEAFMPFGGGPRICIGASFAMAEAQIVLATLLSRFEFGLEDSRPVMPMGGLTTAPQREPLFRLEQVVPAD